MEDLIDQDGVICLKIHFH